MSKKGEWPDGLMEQCAVNRERFVIWIDGERCRTNDQGMTATVPATSFLYSQIDDMGGRTTGHGCRCEHAPSVFITSDRYNRASTRCR